MMDKELEFRSSPLVKGKRDLARSRATKWMSKADIGGVSKHFPSVTTIWNSRSKNDNGECSVDPFQFSASVQTKMGNQSHRQDYGVSGGGYCGDQGKANTRDGMARQKAGSSVEENLLADGGQCKIRLSATHRGGTKEFRESAPPSVIDTSVVRRKFSRDLVGVKDVRCSAYVHLHIGELAFYEDYLSAQANASIQHPCRGEGVEFGSVGISDDSMSREGKDKGDDGINGMEFEEGSKDFASTG